MISPSVWDALPLGEVPDAVLAEELGVSRQAVTWQRLKRKIAPYNPPSREVSKGLREIVYRQLCRYVPKPFHEIYQDVLNDWGSVTERTVHRALKALREEGKIRKAQLLEDERIGLEWRPGGEGGVGYGYGYVRM